MISVIPPESIAQITHVTHFALVILAINILNFVIYRSILAVYTQLYGRREARRLAYGTGWTFAIVAIPLAYWWFFG